MMFMALLPLAMALTSPFPLPHWVDFTPQPLGVQRNLCFPCLAPWFVLHLLIQPLPLPVYHLCGLLSLYNLQVQIHPPQLPMNLLQSLVYFLSASSFNPPHLLLIHFWVITLVSKSVLACFLSLEEPLDHQGRYDE